MQLPGDDADGSLELKNAVVIDLFYDNRLVLPRKPGRLAVVAHKGFSQGGFYHFVNCLPEIFLDGVLLILNAAEEGIKVFPEPEMLVDLMVDAENADNVPYVVSDEKGSAFQNFSVARHSPVVAETVLSFPLFEDAYHPVCGWVAHVSSADMAVSDFDN